MNRCRGLLAFFAVVACACGETSNTLPTRDAAMSVSDMFSQTDGSIGSDNGASSNQDAGPAHLGGSNRPACQNTNDCLPSESCIDGVCEPNVRCEVNADCRSGEVCDDGRCIARTSA